MIQSNQDLALCALFPDWAELTPPFSLPVQITGFGAGFSPHCEELTPQKGWCLCEAEGRLPEPKGSQIPHDSESWHPDRQLGSRLRDGPWCQEPLSRSLGLQVTAQSSSKLWGLCHRCFLWLLWFILSMNPSHEHCKFFLTHPDVVMLGEISSRETVCSARGYHWNGF